MSNSYIGLLIDIVYKDTFSLILSNRIPRHWEGVPKSEHEDYVYEFLWVLYAIRNR